MMYMEFEADRQKQQLSIRIFSEIMWPPATEVTPRHILIGERILEPIPDWYSSNFPLETVTLHTVLEK